MVFSLEVRVVGHGSSQENAYEQSVQPRLTCNRFFFDRLKLPESCQDAKILDEDVLNRVAAQ